MRKPLSTPAVVRTLAALNVARPHVATANPSQVFQRARPAASAVHPFFK